MLSWPEGTLQVCTPQWPQTSMGWVIGACITMNFHCSLGDMKEQIKPILQMETLSHEKKINLDKKKDASSFFI